MTNKRVQRKTAGLVFGAVVLFALAAAVPAQLVPDASLWIAKCKADESICDTQEIVRYDFVKGEPTGTETVLTSETLKIRFDLGRNRIIEGHYLVSSWGDVIDLKTKEVLHQSSGELLFIRGKKLIIEVNNVDDEGIFAFELENRTFQKLRDRQDWPDLTGEHFSPDTKLVAVAVPETATFNFYAVDEKLGLRLLKAVKGKKFESSCSMRCNDAGRRPPFVWIDNSKILTQTENGQIVTVSLSGAVEKVAKIPFAGSPDSLPSIWVDRFRNYFYEIDGQEYLLDLNRKSATDARLPLGAGFSLERGELFWKEYFFNGASIGKVWSGETMATNDYLAMEYANEGTNLGYPDGIKVWNTSRREWVTIPIKWGVKLIAWTKP